MRGFLCADNAFIVKNWQKFFEKFQYRFRMAMEVLAAEFPDIFNQYIEIVPEVVTEEVEVLPVAPVAPSPVPVEEVRVVNVTSKTIQDIFLEHDYGQTVSGPVKGRSKFVVVAPTLGEARL